jgi:hypothetical protein
MLHTFLHRFLNVWTQWVDGWREYKKVHQRGNVTDRGRHSGFSGLVVSMLASGTQVHGFKPG